MEDVESEPGEDLRSVRPAPSWPGSNEASRSELGVRGAMVELGGERYMSRDEMEVPVSGRPPAARGMEPGCRLGEADGLGEPSPVLSTAGQSDLSTGNERPVGSRWARIAAAWMGTS